MSETNIDAVISFLLSFGMAAAGANLIGPNVSHTPETDIGLGLLIIGMFALGLTAGRPEKR